MLILIARLLALLVVGVMLIPWLSRYLPWRAERLANVRAAHQAIRRAPSDMSIGRDAAGAGDSRAQPPVRTRTCSSTRPIRSATSPPGATSAWPGPSSRASGLR